MKTLIIPKKVKKLGRYKLQNFVKVSNRNDEVFLKIITGYGCNNFCTITIQIREV